MSTLMSAMLTQLGADLDDGWSSVTTAAGDTTKTYLVDDLLYEKVADWIDDGMVVYLPLGPSGAGTAETRIVDSIQFNNRLVIKTYFSAQVLGTSVPYEVHRLFTRNQKLVALRQAATLLFPEYFTVVRDSSLVIVANQYEYDISSLSIHNNRPHQVLISQYIIRDIWVKNTVYAADAYVRPTSLTTFTGLVYKCTTGGTSHASTEPTWPDTVGDTVTDGTVVWEAQSENDYSNLPMIPLHDWDITPDGKLLINQEFTAGLTLTIVGIKPLAFTGSGASETIAIDSPYSLVLSARAATYLCNQKISNATTQDASRWDGLKQRWETELALRKVQYPMRAPDGTIITGGGLTV